MTEPHAITPAQMRELINAGQGEVLISGHFPVPVLLAGRWWHVPDTSDTGEFVPAPPEAGAEFDRLHARRRRADGAVRDADRSARP